MPWATTRPRDRERCNLCLDFGVVHGSASRQVTQFELAKRGWVYTVEHGWTCPDCRAGKLRQGRLPGT
jgi:hypothetical protein